MGVIVVMPCKIYPMPINVFFMGVYSIEHNLNAEQGINKSYLRGVIVSVLNHGTTKPLFSFQGII